MAQASSALRVAMLSAFLIAGVLFLHDIAGALLRGDASWSEGAEARAAAAPATGAATASMPVPAAVPAGVPEPTARPARESYALLAQTQGQTQGQSQDPAPAGTGARTGFGANAGAGIEARTGKGALGTGAAASRPAPSADSLAARTARIEAIALSPAAEDAAIARARDTLHLPLAELDRRSARARDVAFWARMDGAGTSAEVTLGYCARPESGRDDALDCLVFGAVEKLGMVQGERRLTPLGDVLDWSFARDGRWEGAFRLRARLPMMREDDRAAVEARLAPEPPGDGAALQMQGGAR